MQILTGYRYYYYFKYFKQCLERTLTVEVTYKIVRPEQTAEFRNLPAQTGVPHSEHPGLCIAKRKKLSSFEALSLSRGTLGGHMPEAGNCCSNCWGHRKPIEVGHRAVTSREVTRGTTVSPCVPNLQAAGLKGPWE